MAVIALVSRLLQEHGLRYDSMAEDADLDDIEKVYLRSGGAFKVVENSKGEIVGTFALYPMQDSACQLRKMYLSPILRGQGLGLRMLRCAVDDARGLGFKKIVLETANVLKKAIRLYTRFGFKPMDGAPHSKRCDQAYFLDL